MCQNHAHLIEAPTAAASPAEATNDPFHVLEALLSRARSLPPGSDVEGFMEDNLPELMRATRATAAQQRADEQAASIKEGDFPPSAMS